MKQKEPEDKQPDELEEIQAELRLYGDEAVSDDIGWTLDVKKDYDKSLLTLSPSY